MSRVVVTGLGVVSPIGLSLKEAWANLLAGKCGVSRLTSPGYETLPCKIAATVDINLDEHFSKSELRAMAPATALGILAADEALKDSQWLPTDWRDLEETGVRNSFDNNL